MAVRVLVLVFTATLSTNAFFLDTIDQGRSHYNSYNLHEPCTHIKALIHEWEKAHHLEAVRKIYEYIVTHESNHQGHIENDRKVRYTYSSTFDEAFNNHNRNPDVSRVEQLISHNRESGCMQTLQSYCEELLHIQVNSHHHQSTHKPTEKPTTVHVTPHKTTTTLPPTTTTLPPTTTTIPPTTTTLPPTTAMPPTTTTIPITTMTEQPSTTTLPPLNLKTCDAFAFVMALASGDKVLQQSAGLCSDGTHSQSEAVLLKTCKSPAPSTWTAGPKVIENCSRIPAYTPIATFEFGQYNMDSSSLSGIFVECTDDGFKMAAQLCGHGPEIYTIHKGGSTLRQDANSYFVVNI
ncbi:uncharacterized protein LOC125648029 [Ostrea edulis]|uniref:uncharacterized protein LOC125648029 n=1 Tax=Ostrea edulis TaxID=37623 RepID=UPI0020946AF6|nr:uncharacterized protein LOC125648029 [Ostrea edulis]